ncbi:MAG: hypothetical protein IT186_02065 [Acidobacteria bacterium]|nr:hypothetical protein [Acidobacteriota bacterium]
MRFTAPLFLLLVLNATSAWTDLDPGTANLLEISQRVQQQVAKAGDDWLPQNADRVDERKHIRWQRREPIPVPEGRPAALWNEVKLDIEALATPEAATSAFDQRVRGAGIGPNERRRNLGDDCAGWAKAPARGPSMYLVRKGFYLFTVVAPTAAEAEAFARMTLTAIVSTERQ